MGLKTGGTGEAPPCRSAIEASDEGFGRLVPGSRSRTAQRAEPTFFPTIKKL
jgi:hypothetical protein